MPKLHLHAMSSVSITLNTNETISVTLVTRYCMATSHGFGHRPAGGFMLVPSGGTSDWQFELFDCQAGGLQMEEALLVSLVGACKACKYEGKKQLLT